MTIRRMICLCGTLLTKDEREHHVYQCTLCVSREHELILAHGRGESHDEIDRLFLSPVDLGLKPRRAQNRRAKAGS